MSVVCLIRAIFLEVHFLQLILILCQKWLFVGQIQVEIRGSVLNWRQDLEECQSKSGSDKVLEQVIEIVRPVQEVVGNSREELVDLLILEACNFDPDDEVHQGEDDQDGFELCSLNV